MILPITLIILVCILVVILLFFKKNKAISIILLVPLLAVLCFGVYFFYQTSYKTSPDSLQITVQEQGNKYLAEGQWKDRLEKYRFVSDFIVFYVPNNEKITDVKRTPVKDYKNMNSTFFEKEIKSQGSEVINSKWKPQIFDIKAQNKFQFSFELPNEVKPSDVKVYYVHSVEEPMNSLELWFKEIKLD
ncbi:hypothetical protein [Priestia megaterium]|uniref:hypothetical protein n=1 Tax=Priestia megaterium TaxID=1404 RepID=UPI000BFDADAA|nr:hypothetical protein [Priestia megaterium]MBW0934206.1 hypothetical protein [Priestia megaterium]PGX80594.1 hypothetical protein COE31_04560 [Priestia megaterium]